MLCPVASVNHRFSMVRSPLLPGVELARSQHRGEPAPRQFLPVVQVLHFQAGSVRAELDGSEFVIEPGDIILSGPDRNPCVVARLSDWATTFRCFIRPAVFNALAGPGADSFDSVVVRSASLAAAVDGLHDAITAQAPGDRLRGGMVSLVREMLHALTDPSRRSAPAGSLRSEVAHARRILRQRFDAPVSLEELARDVGLSKFYLLRQFREQVGVTPHTFQLLVRVSHARAMLHDGVSAAEVALACGFADQPHFTRCFKRVVGSTPAAFARLAGSPLSLHVIRDEEVRARKLQRVAGVG